jgi:hypothetical protein
MGCVALNFTTVHPYSFALRCPSPTRPFLTASTSLALPATQTALSAGPLTIQSSKPKSLFNKHQVAHIHHRWRSWRHPHRSRRCQRANCARTGCRGVVAWDGKSDASVIIWQDGVILTPPEGRSRCLTNATFRFWLFCHRHSHHYHHHHHHHYHHNYSHHRHIIHNASNVCCRATTEVYPDSQSVTAEQCNRSSCKRIPT